MPPLHVLSRVVLSINEHTTTNTYISSDDSESAGRRLGDALVRVGAAHVFDGLLPRRGRSTSRPERERTHSYYACHQCENEEGGGVAEAAEPLLGRDGRWQQAAGEDPGVTRMLILGPSTLALH
mgnify:CR=1 FL=1